MNMRDLMPRIRGTGTTPLRHDGEWNPFTSIQREMNRLFDSALREFDVPGIAQRVGSWTSAWPSVEVEDAEREVRVIAEVPGMDEKDIEVLLDEGVLTLRGEKKAQGSDAHRQFSERWYGRFERRIPIEQDIERDQVRADFRHGVLTVTLPKTERARTSARRIPIGGGSGPAQG